MFSFRNKSKFISLKKTKGGNVILGNSALAKVMGKGKGNLVVKNTNAAKVLLVEGLKHNILSVGQITDREHIVIFTSRGCRVIEEETRKVIAKGIRTPEKVYVLKRSKGRNKRMKVISSSDSE